MSGRIRYMYDFTNQDVNSAKSVGCIYSESNGGEVKYSAVFCHPREEVVVNTVPHPTLPGKTRKQFVVNTSKVRLREAAKAAFAAGNVRTVAVGAKDKTAYKMTKAVLENLMTHLPETTRAFRVVEDELLVLELCF